MEETQYMLWVCHDDTWKMDEFFATAEDAEIAWTKMKQGNRGPCLSDFRIVPINVYKSGE